MGPYMSGILQIAQGYELTNVDFTTYNTMLSSST